MAKKKSIDLSKLIKQYDIKNDIDPTNQYGLGSFLKDNAGGLLKTAAGAALTATGAGAPIGIGMMASGATDIASKELARTPEEEALMQTAGGIGGQVGGMAASGAFQNTQMAQGGDLTQYNGGGTHEQNPNGGIDIGANAQVEDKETRWEDYIFSERINIPGKKYSFAEASKKIEKRYKRENDPYEKKAKEKEMKALMSMQEMEREKMNAAHNAAMQKAFGGDINQFPDGGDMTFITNPDQLSQLNREAEQLRISQIQDAGNATGDDYMNPQQRAAAIKDKFGTMSFSDSILNDLNNATPPNANTSFDTSNINSNKSLAEKLKSTNYSNSSVTTGNLTPEQILANQQNIDITPFSQNENLKRLVGQPNEEMFSGYIPKYNADRTKVEYDRNNPIYKEKMSRTAEIDDFKQYLGTQLGLPLTERGLIDASKLDPNFSVSKEQLAKLDQDKLNRYYDNLDWKNKLRKHEGWQEKTYYGENEAKKFGYTADTPLRELNFGPRFLTGVQDRDFDKVGAEQKAYGGKVKAQFGLDLNQFNAINQTLNPNIGALAPGASQQGVMRNPNEGDFYNTLTDYNNKGLSPEQIAGRQAHEDYINNSNLNSPEQQNNLNDSDNKFDWGQAAMFGAQNMGNIYNLIKGTQGAEQVDLGQINPQKYDYSKAIKNAEDRYSSAANQARETIRKTATGSGQALSNLIAAETSLTGGKERATRDIMQQQENQNTGLTNQAEQYNLGLTNQENQINSQNEAMKDQFLAQGLSGIGSNIAQFSRDQRADKMQKGYIENLLKTGNYEIDPVTGKVRLIGSNTQG